jgi:hypothetical protein
MLPTPTGLPRPLPTSRYTISTEGTNAVFDGHGWGHGVGMSQYGALGKAQRGMKAADILAAYYSGIRPTKGDASVLAPTIKVAVSDGGGATTVSSPGLFRVVDGKGTTIAPVATGSWRVTPASGGVRLTPPEDQRASPVIAVPTLDPPDPPIGAPATVRFQVSAPALVSGTVTPHGAPPQPLPSQVAPAGDVTMGLPPASGGGVYEVFLVADAGPGRQSALPFRFEVIGPARPSAAPSAVSVHRVPALKHNGGAPLVVKIVAGLLVVIEAVALFRITRRRPSPIP